MNICALRFSICRTTISKSSFEASFSQTAEEAKKHFLAAGAVLGAGVLLREESYCAAAALGAALALRRDLRSLRHLGMGFLVVAVPIWIGQYREFGHILGLHGGNYYLNNRVEMDFSLIRELRGMVWNYYHHLFRFDAFRTPWLNHLCLFPVFAGCILGAFVSPRWNRVKAVTGAAALTGWTALTVAFALNDRSAAAFSAAAVTGIIGSNPLFFPFFANWRRAWNSRIPAVQTAARFAMIYLLAVPPLLTRSDIGLIYGARHFLCIMPALLMLSVRFSPLRYPGRALPAGRKFSAGVLFRGLALVSLLLQFSSLAFLRTTALESERFEEKINALPETVMVTDAFFLPEQTPRLFFTKTVLQLDDGNAAGVIEFLRRSGESRFLLVLSNRYRHVSDSKLAGLLESAPPVSAPERFRDRRSSGFMDFYIVRCRLK